MYVQYVMEVYFNVFRDYCISPHQCGLVGPEKYQMSSQDFNLSSQSQNSLITICDYLSPLLCSKTILAFSPDHGLSASFSLFL